MAYYEAAAAIALRNHLRRAGEQDGHAGEKGGARSQGKPKKVEEEKVVMRCGFPRVLKPVVPVSMASASGKTR
ncbi:hypothetical protein SETIT_6G043900v2 [Setaria italica]|uniref:Uncharacterized protein n=1 Tax=Setaria italica TaxID=4555 RepID=A0A368RHY7_SETIT|nr:hypothetical protein SETIT_6G043900v2 [Setaria italica]